MNCGPGVHPLIYSSSFILLIAGPKLRYKCKDDCNLEYKYKL